MSAPTAIRRSMWPGIVLAVFVVDAVAGTGALPKGVQHPLLPRSAAITPTSFSSADHFTVTVRFVGSAGRAGAVVDIGPMYFRAITTLSYHLMFCRLVLLLMWKLSSTLSIFSVLTSRSRT